MAQGIKSVGNIALLSEERINEISILFPKKRISESKLMSFHADAVQSLPGSPPPKTDHRKTVNPYLAKYGKDEWEGHVNKCSGMSPYVSITDLVEHIVAESAKVMEGTEHEDN